MKKFMAVVALLGTISLAGCTEDSRSYTIKNVFSDDPTTVYVTEVHKDGSEKNYTVIFETASEARAYMESGD